MQGLLLYENFLRVNRYFSHFRTFATIFSHVLQIMESDADVVIFGLYLSGFDCHTITLEMHL